VPLLEELEIQSRRPQLSGGRGGASVAKKKLPAGLKKFQFKKGSGKKGKKKGGSK
jgi:hypothetical protein